MSRAGKQGIEARAPRRAARHRALFAESDWVRESEWWRKVLGIATVEVGQKEEARHGWGPQEASYLAERIGERLGLPQDEVRAVSLGMLLVELSKLAVTEIAGRGREPLGESEWKLVHERARRAAWLLVPLRSVAGVRAIVDGWREHWDGTGSPRGLAGDAIPLGSRILAVSEGFCEIAGAHGNGKARTPSAALAELRNLAGTRYDPVCVRELLTVVQ
jgi:response regulator RpfG family c-di-GMP phosphodiesterase